MLPLSSDIHFKIDAHYPKEFPRSIPLSDVINLSFLSLEESFKTAQNSFLPYYSLTVIESGEGEERFFQIYDTSYFAALHLNKGPNYRDPVTHRPIQKIHYFAMKCFKINENEGQICQPINLQKETVELLPLDTDQMLPNIQKMLLDSVNGNIFLTGTEEDQQQVRRTQYIIGNLIKTKKIFNDLEEENQARTKETIQWLWCSSQGSYQGLVLLANECLAHPNLFFDVKQQVIKQLSSKTCHLPTKSLSLQERLAYVEAKNLLNKLSSPNSRNLKGSRGSTYDRGSPRGSGSHNKSGGSQKPHYPK